MLIDKLNNQGWHMYSILKKDVGIIRDDMYISNEDFIASTKEVLKDVFDRLITMVNDDISIGITNDDIFISSKYKTLLGEINKEIVDKYNVDLIMLSGNKTSVYIKDVDSKKELIGLIKSGVNGKKINVDKEMKNLKKSLHSIKGNKLSETLKMYLVINLYGLIVNDKVSSEYLVNLVETSVYNTLDGVNMVTTLMDDASEILTDIKKGKTIDDIYVNHLNGKRDNIVGKSDFNKASLLIDGMISKYGENGGDSKEDQKMSMFVRMFYIIALVNIIVIITVASTTPVLMYSVVTLIIYTVFLYIYRLAAKVITGKNDPLNENFSGIIAPDEVKMVDKDIATVDNDISNIISKESKSKGNEYMLMYNAIKNDLITNVSDYVTKLFRR